MRLNAVRRGTGAPIVFIHGLGMSAASWDACALTVLARVVTRPAADRIILDSGSKTLTNDLARGITPTPGHGSILTSIEGPQVPDEDLVVERLSEEHATVRVRSGDHALRPGDLVRVVPNHACTVSNLVESAWLVDGSDAVGPLQISARGRITSPTTSSPSSSPREAICTSTVPPSPWR